MADFFRFPSTPHLAWLGGGEPPREDKLISSAEAADLLAGEVVVEEKLDGANLGFSLALDGTLCAQNRGQYLAEPHAGQFARLPFWLSQHGNSLNAAITPGLVVFGEWCAARHSLDYSALPDWFLLFDVYDRDSGFFWSTPRRNLLAKEIGLVTVPCLAQGRTSVDELKRTVMNTPSRYRGGRPLEGVVVRRESTSWCEARAKLVRPDFTQAIETHWSRRVIEWNRVDFTTVDSP